MSEIKITAEPRTDFGKGYARRIRAVGDIPAVIYGNGKEPKHVTLPGHATTLAVHNKNVVLEKYPAQKFCFCTPRYS